MARASPPPRRVSLLAVGLVLLMILPPGIAQTQTPTAATLPVGSGVPPTGGPWDGPWQDAQMPEAQVQRFMSLWTPRVQDSSWMENYTRFPGVPPEIMAEGFHQQTDPRQQMYLVERLFEGIWNNDTQYQLQMAAAPAAQRNEELDGVRTMLVNLVFNKDAALGDLLRSANQTASAVGDSPLDPAYLAAIAAAQTSNVTPPVNVTPPTPPLDVISTADDLAAAAGAVAPPGVPDPTDLATLPSLPAIPSPSVPVPPPAG
ncbi:MAG: hypothetical protein QOE90_1462, partial [Thermoplasmata archaeon]|nr:hypothetical protein [Thermoplasmata archaeon]